MHISTVPPAVINLFGTSSEHFGFMKRYYSWSWGVKQYKERPISTTLAEHRKSVSLCVMQ